MGRCYPCRPRKLPLFMLPPFMFTPPPKLFSLPPQRHQESLSNSLRNDSHNYNNLNNLNYPRLSSFNPLHFNNHCQEHLELFLCPVMLHHT